MSEFYTLEGKEPKAATLKQFAAWLRSDDHIQTIAKNDLGNGVRVSTVFLGVNHNFIGTGDPVLFETMIFGGGLDGYQERFTSYDDAEVGHDIALRLAKGAVEV